jgi:hypothetical protein
VQNVHGKWLESVDKRTGKGKKEDERNKEDYPDLRIKQGVPHPRKIKQFFLLYFAHVSIRLWQIPGREKSGKNGDGAGNKKWQSRMNTDGESGNSWSKDKAKVKS